MDLPFTGQSHLITGNDAASWITGRVCAPDMSTMLEPVFAPDTLRGAV